MTQQHRRHFLKASAGLLAAPAFAANKRGPNDRIRVAIVGLRGRGRNHITAFHELAAQNVEIAAMCDVDSTLLAQRVSAYQKESGKKVETATDMRRIFDNKEIDAVAFATPNHWHALGAVWACQAGKDVYLEKPGTQNFLEGPKVIEAAKKYNCIVAHGTQNRSSPNIVEGIRKLKEGVIGRVYLARGVAFKYRAQIRKPIADPIPEGLDWDRWLGPAPKVPYSKAIQGSSGGGWHLMWDYGNGEIGNQGVHELDIIRWALDLDAHPNKIVSMGGAYVHRDHQQAPQVQSIMFEWQNRDVLVSFETRGGYTNTEAGMGAEYPFLDKRNVVGVIFVGTEGYMILPDYSSYYTFLGPNRTPGPKASGSNDITDLPHFENFIKAVRSRNAGDLAAGTREIHMSSALAHLANIAQRTGRMIHFDPVAEKIKNEPEANRLLGRTWRAPYTMPEKV